MLGNNGPAPVRTGARHGWLVLVAVTALCAFPTLAVAADEPTPEQLWNAYPLNPPAKGPQLEVPPSSGVATPAPERKTAPASDAGSGFPIALAVGLGVVLFAIGLVLGSRRRRSTPAAANSPLGTRPGSTCEIRWRGGIVGPHFRAVMTVPGEGERLVARSPKVDWPPVLPPTPEPQVVDAARALARDLVDAGWRPEGHGTEWYSQRFAWAGARTQQSLDQKEPVPGG